MADDISNKEVTDFSNRLSGLMLHDLASPLGAVANALELVNGSEGVRAEAVELLQDAAQDLIARHAFLRVAVAGNRAGSAGDGLAKALGGYVEAREATFDWQPSTPLPSAEAIQMLALMVGIVARGLGRRDTLIITDTLEDRDWVVTVTAEGRRAKLTEGAEEILTGKANRASETKDMFAELLARLLGGDRAALSVVVEEKKVALTLRQPF
ncbi:MAG: histidine phosphotransferase family protein [Alphaproteobacteria bacterium]